MAAKDSAGTSSTNDLVVMPLSRMQRTISGYGGLSTIVVDATSADDVSAAVVETTVVLRDALGVASGEDDPFTVSSQSQLLSTADSATSTFTSMLTAVAVLSLGVGVLFGGYPAWRAAAMRPVDALRHD